MKKLLVKNLIFCFIVNIFYGQAIDSRLWIKKLDDEKKYQIHYRITNNSSETIMMVIDTTGFESYDEYDWYGYKYSYQDLTKRKPFSPRLKIIDEIAKGTLDMWFGARMPQWTEQALDSILRDKEEKERKELARLKEIKSKYHLNKDINWVGYYDYIKRHAIILKPNQFLDVYNSMDLSEIYEDELGYIVGFCLDINRKYAVTLKFHQDRKWVSKHLTKDMLEKYKRQKIIIYDGVSISNEVEIKGCSNIDESFYEIPGIFIK